MDGFKILDIKTIGDFLMILKMDKVDEVASTKATLLNTYGEDIMFMPVSQVEPMVKISRLYCDSNEVLQIREQILKQNDWINHEDFEITNTYFTEPQNERKFATIIVQSSLKTHVDLLTKGYIIYGLKKSVINEHIRVLQCGRC